MTTKPPGENGSHTSDILLSMNSQNLVVQAIEEVAERRIAESATGLINIQVKLMEIINVIFDKISTDASTVIYLKHEKVARDTSRGIVTRIEAALSMFEEISWKKEFLQKQGSKMLHELQSLKSEAEKLDFKRMHEDLEGITKDLGGKRLDPKAFQKRLEKIKAKIDDNLEKGRPWLTAKEDYQQRFQYFNYDILSPIRKNIIKNLDALANSSFNEDECRYQASMLLVIFDNFQDQNRERYFKNIIKFEEDYLNKLEEPSIILYKLCIAHEDFANVVLGNKRLREKIEAPHLAEILYKYENNDAVKKMLASNELRDPLDVKKLAEHSKDSAVWILCSPVLMKSLNNRGSFLTDKMLDNFSKSLEDNREDVNFVVATACEDREYAEILLKILLKINETNPKIIRDEDLDPIFDKYPDLVPKEFESSITESTPRDNEYSEDFEKDEEEEAENRRLEALRQQTAASVKAKFKPKESETEVQQRFPDIRQDRPPIEKMKPHTSEKQPTRMPGLGAQAIPANSAAKPAAVRSKLGTQGKAVEAARREYEEGQLGSKLASKSNAQPGPGAALRFSQPAKAPPLVKKPGAGVPLQPLKPKIQTVAEENDSDLDYDPDSRNQPPLP